MAAYTRNCAGMSRRNTFPETTKAVTNACKASEAKVLKPKTRAKQSLLIIFATAELKKRGEKLCVSHLGK